MPVCRKCGKNFPNKIEIDGKLRSLSRRNFCLSCRPFRGHIASADEAKKKKAEKYRRWQKKARIERKRKLVDLLGGKCIQCGYDRCIAALDFHHRNDKEKSFNIALHGLCRKWDDLKEEVLKCDLLCKNCHTEKHYKAL